MSPIQIQGSSVHSWPRRISRGRAVQWLARQFGALAAKWRTRLAMHQLARLDDRMLADIGISRGEIEFVTRYRRDGAAILSAAQTQSRALAAAHFPPL